MKKTLLHRFVLYAGVGAIVLAAVLVPSAMPQNKDAKAAAVPNATAAGVSSTNAMSHTLAATNAEAAWAELDESSRPPTPPAEWQFIEPTKEMQARFLMPYALVIADKAKDFYTKFPADTNTLGARQREFGILTWAVENGATNQQARLEASEKTLLADSRLSEDDRFGLRHDAVLRTVKLKEAEGDAAMLAEFEKGTRILQKEFPKNPDVLAMLIGIAENSEPENARSILKEVAASDAPTELKDAASDISKRLERVGTPLTLKFLALDGREVDLAKMQGKVVLVDFWATWCEPCVAEMPHIKQTFDKFHTNGLEIIGISQDEDKESLTNFVAQNQLPWAQYFDGKNMESKYAQEFGIKEIPTLWLVDKKGVVRYVNAGFDTEKRIGKLLAE